ncbi:hypothetical protein Zm00014a_012596 [Zea mays]|jgi:hypothetical protein|uniref:Uncharacterized protein n=1 Tax=Zea mays TaxID=4577 RepID=A0A3L6E8R5_MAIZE|nr:hypothetical protein Zm00014a_012596 [Zea mays]
MLQFRKIRDRRVDHVDSDYASDLDKMRYLTSMFSPLVVVVLLDGKQVCRLLLLYLLQKLKIWLFLELVKLFG